MDKELLKILEENGIQHIKEIPGQGVCGLVGMLFTTGLTCNNDKFGYGYRYCYESFSEALRDISTWDGINDPPGNWIKRKGLGDDFLNPNYEEH